MRKPAPAIEIGFADNRNEIIKSLDETNPEFVHGFAGSNLSVAQLNAKKLEVVMGKNGEPLMHHGDVVVRTERKLADEKAKAEAAASRKQVEAVVEPERSTVFANAKKQRE